jgi:hypothetical protein
VYSTRPQRYGGQFWSTSNGTLRNLNDEPRNEMRRLSRRGRGNGGRWSTKTRRLGVYLDIMDESGFRLVPTVRRTWAPRGKTPLLYHSYRRDRISAVSGLTSCRRFHAHGTGRTPHNSLPMNTFGLKANATLRTPHPRTLTS